MGNLNCNAASCMHNCDNQCCLNSICVEGSSACITARYAVVFVREKNI